MLVTTAVRPAENTLLVTTVVKPQSEDVKTPYPVLQAIVKGQPGFYVWHVVKFALERVPEEEIGNFFTGDCYIIFAVMDKNMNDMRIHYWIGNESSIDEQAVAAMLSFGLDDHFGGRPVQTRELQGHESGMFLKYFADRKKPLHYMAGGVGSGLRHAMKKPHVDTLFHVKGSTRAHRVASAPISWESFNDGDTFVLDLGTVIFVWKGKHATKSDFFVGSQFAAQLRTDRGLRKCVVEIIEDGRETETIADKNNLEMWNKHLPLSEKKVKPAEHGTKTDDAIVKEQTSHIKLHWCKEKDGTTTITEIKKKGLVSRADLKSEDSFIVDNGPDGVWAWIGKGATADERRLAMHFAVGFVESNKYPATTRVSRVCDGAETAEFCALFADWPDLEKKAPPPTSKPN